MGTSAGFEEDLSYTKDFFGAGLGAETSVFSAMSNLLVLGKPGRIQEYIVSGVGLVRLRVSLNQTAVNSSVIGYDLGGGANAFFTKHLGIRGDVRYLHTFQDVMCSSPAGSSVSDAPASASPSSSSFRPSSFRMMTRLPYHFPAALVSSLLLIRLFQPLPGECPGARASARFLRGTPCSVPWVLTGEDASHILIMLGRRRW